MAAEWRPLPQVKLPSGPATTTAEQRYWRTFKNQLLISSPTSYPITHISAPPPSSSSSLPSSSSAAQSANDLFAVTTGTRVQLYSIRTRKLVKTIARFGDVARSGELRGDGRVLAAGDDSGVVQVFEVGSRAILKTWQPPRAGKQQQPVWAVRWAPHGRTQVLTGSDDKTVRLWDLTENAPTQTFSGHGDYVRAAAWMPAGGAMQGLVVSGSYDATVRLWDPRLPAHAAAVLTFKHSDPVEAVLPLASSTTVLAAAGSKVAVLDLVAARPRHLVANHQKTVTALALAGGGDRLVTGALDGHVKVFETTGWNVVAGMKYPAPVLSVCVIPAPGGGDDGAGDKAETTNTTSTTSPGGRALDDRHLAVGLQSGLLSIRTRLTGLSAARERARAAEMAALLAGDTARLDGRRAARASGRSRLSVLGAGADTVLWDPLDASTWASGAKRRRVSGREQRWQLALRRGRPAAALDAALDSQDKAYKPLNVLTCVAALRHRGQLTEALEPRGDGGGGGRGDDGGAGAARPDDADEARALDVLRFAVAHVADPRYRDACAELAAMVLDLYAESLGKSGGKGGGGELAATFKTLHKRVRVEVERSQVACQTGGMVESLMMGMM